MLKTALAVVYLLSIPGVSAWAQVARVEALPTLRLAVSAPAAPSLSAPAAASLPLAAAAFTPAVPLAAAVSASPAVAAAPTAASAPADDAAPHHAAAAAPASVPAPVATDHGVVAARVEVALSGTAAALTQGERTQAGQAPGAPVPEASSASRPLALGRRESSRRAPEAAAARREPGDGKVSHRDAIVAGLFIAAMIGAYVMAIHTLVDLAAQWEGQLQNSGGSLGIDGAAALGGILGLKGAAKAANAEPAAPRRKISREARDTVAAAVLLAAIVAGVVGLGTVAANWMTDGLINLEQSLHDLPSEPLDQGPPPNI